MLGPRHELGAGMWLERMSFLAGRRNGLGLQCLSGPIFSYSIQCRSHRATVYDPQEDADRSREFEQAPRRQPPKGIDQARRHLSWRGRHEPVEFESTR